MNVTPKLEERLRQLVHLFLAENARVNLSAFRTEETCWIGNVLDALAAQEVLRVPAQARFLDLGTGGGFPLLPLAVALQAVSFTGMDATGKKIDAVRRIAASMGLENVVVICGRAEALGRDPRLHERFDVVLARAVAEVNVLLEYCSPFVKQGGTIVLWKSMDIDGEMKDSAHAQKELRCAFRQSIVYDLPGDFGKRQLLIFEKTGRVSGNYPRGVGVAKKKPL